ncbi:MAG: TonB-dependent receptor [Bacteroidales bacterium]|jgi:TonB-linked SusC/RagA family outer membrane protein|nr:TonB-dependent receptor [Bacteroidales bacterium]MCI2145731.1 TonB-dependent receptor [Bacteroidales bacterium]
MKKLLTLLLLGLSCVAFAQNKRTITGKVTGDNDEPFVGVFVTEQGTNNGAPTDIDGNYSITVRNGATLVFTFIGYKTQTFAVGESSVINVNMEQDVSNLEEVVVIGYGTSKRSSLTGSLSQVSSSSFENQKVTRVDQALQGRASGVQVSNTVGAPGGDVRIRIRGANSILGDNSPLFVVDGFVGVDFSSINPEDIASIEVLKDASSTAIYGSRGANGVVLITTKAGSKNGKINVTYDGSVTVSNIIKKYDLLSAGQYAEAYNAHSEAFGLNPQFTQDEIDEYYENGGYDYVDAVLRTAISHQHQLSISGGTTQTQWRISGNYLNQEGIVKESSYDRFNVRANLNTNVNDRLSFRFNINTSTSNGYNNSGYSGASTVLNQAIAWAPTTDPYNEDGTYVTNDPVGSLKANPLALIYDAESIAEKTFITMLGGLNYKIMDGFSIDLQAASDQQFLKDKSWSGTYASRGTPSAGLTDSKARTIQTTSQISYDKTFGNHSINAVAAVETQSYTYSSHQSTSTGLVFPSLKYDNLSQATSKETASDYSMWTLLSYIARVNYSYADKYLASVSIRRDGSSKFSDDNKFSTFPAAAVAWNLGKEEFMKNVTVISNLKIRASWGFTGSQAISPYATKYLFDGTTYPFSMGTSTSGIIAGDPANTDLKWETTEQKDIGFDIGLFDGRISLEADYYVKDTKDLLLDKNVPAYLGGSSITSNIGKMRNNGFDFTLTGKIIEKKDISLESSVNFSILKNKVVDLGGNETVYVSTNLTGINDGAYDLIYRVGQPLGTLFGLKYLGPWQADEADLAAEYGCVPGDARYEDRDGNKIYDSSDYQIIGYAMPKYTLGWNTSFNWKNFSFNMFLQGVFGTDKLNYNRCINMMASRDVRGARFTEILERYIPGVQEDTYLPSWSTTSKWYPVSSLWLEDASFLRMKNLSVAYDFSVPDLADFTVSLNATNLFTITKYKGIDPEASNVGSDSDVTQGLDYGAYPNSRSFTIGLNVKF